MLQCGQMFAKKDMSHYETVDRTLHPPPVDEKLTYTMSSLKEEHKKNILVIMDSALCCDGGGATSTPDSKMP